MLLFATLLGSFIISSIYPFNRRLKSYFLTLPEEILNFREFNVGAFLHVYYLCCCCIMHGQGSVSSNIARPLVFRSRCSVCSVQCKADWHTYISLNLFINNCRHVTYNEPTRRKANGCNVFLIFDLLPVCQQKKQKNMTID